MPKTKKKTQKNFSDELDFDWEDEEFESPRPAKKKRRTKKKKKNELPPEGLLGKCLVHIGTNPSKEIYNKAVVYITDCTPHMVRGIIINKLLLGTATIECKSKEYGEQESLFQSIYEDLYQGGPESPAHGFVLFPREEYISDVDPFAEIQGEIAVSSSFGVLQEILDGIGPERKIIAMGHCLWKRGELEWEIFNNQWLIIPSSPKLIFDTNFEERWKKAMEASGINMTTYIPRIGLA